MGYENPYSILFEPVQIGPVQAKNRFYQTPHATGMGYAYPNHAIRYREIKAEGGWGVVCGEECMIHPSADHAPTPHLRLYCDNDIPFIARLADGVHRYDALFGLELSHAGKSAANRLTRDYPLGPDVLPYTGVGPYATRAMDKADIKALREWHKAAVRRAVTAGVDIVYVYCAHDLSLLMQFLLLRYNHRTDEYGGSLDNRIRLLREVLEDAKEAAAGKAAVAIRFAVDERRGQDGLCADGESRDIIESLAEEPDLWDVNLSDWSNDSGPSRFFEEGYQEEFTAFVSKATTKPIVGVGRYTSADRMAALVRRGVLDFIGAARPSIADPFLPKKIEENRIEDIRECIGCNICTTNVVLAAPIRCTQNPTIGVEWSRGWHPETAPHINSSDPVLIIGSGPAGLEAALTLARRGVDVLLAEADADLGGRVRKERRLPGLSAWGRVADYRVHHLQQAANVEIYRGNVLSAEEILELGVPHIVLATGAAWRKDGVGRANTAPIQGAEAEWVVSADHVLDGGAFNGRVLVFDDDHYYMGGALAEALRQQGCDVVLATPAAEASAWTRNTLEFPHIQKRLAKQSIQIITSVNITNLQDWQVRLEHLYSTNATILDVDRVVMATFAAPNVSLYEGLKARECDWRDAGIQSVSRIGDCVAPGPIAQAVFDGHRFARAFGRATDRGEGVRFEPVVFDA